MKKYLMYFFLCFQGLASLYAQVDKTFWFAVPEVTDLHADRPIFLQLASNEKASDVLITIPANPSFTPLSVTLAAGELKSVDLTSFIDELENTELDKVVNKGLLIEATEEITAYYEVQGTSPIQGIVNIDIFSLKGKNALGTEFYLPFQTAKGNNYSHYGKDGWSSADIVATENDTQVTIELTKDAVGHAANTTFTITLQKGQTYSLRAAGQLAEDRLVGTYLSSTKPIAVTLKDDSVAENQTVQYTAADLIGDQLIPLSIIGTEYILAEGTAYVLATEDNTSLEVNGVNQTPLDRGEQQAISLSKTPTFIKSSKPVYVLHTISQDGEYGGAIVPPTQCTGSQKVSFIRPEGAGFELTVLIKKGGEDSFVINGEKSVGLIANVFEEVPNTNGEWLYASRDIVDLNIGTVNTIENETREFHLGIKSRVSGASFYGYFSNFGNLDLGLDFQACQGDDIVLSAGEGRDSYEWSTGASVSSITLPSENVVKDSLIWVKITEGQCQAQDTVLVTVGESVKGIDLGDDIELCEGDQYLISLPNQYTYEWSDGTQNKEYTITAEGWYKLIASSQDGCTYMDSIFTTMVALPVADLGNDTLICKGKRLNLQLTEGYNSYEWSTGNTTNSLEISNEGTYSVIVMTQTKDNKICGVAQDEVTVGFWDVHTYNVLTPNDDGENDVFIVDGIEEGDWQLEVYNRWGKRVYYDKHYANTWKPEILTEGTYFFSLIESQKGSCNQFNNWVQIIK